MSELFMTLQNPFVRLIGLVAVGLILLFSVRRFGWLGSIIHWKSRQGSNDAYMKKLAEAILRVCLIWLSGVAIIAEVLFKGNQTEHWYSLTKRFQTMESWLMTATLILAFALIGVISASKEHPKSRIYALILGSTTILAIFVSRSGGLLDSPFSGVIALYVSAFIFMQDSRDTKLSLRGFNLVLVFAVVIFMAAPYLWAWKCGETSIIVWSQTSKTILLWRVAASLVFMILTGLAAYFVDRQVDDIKVKVE